MPLKQRLRDGSRLGGRELARLGCGRVWGPQSAVPAQGCCGPWHTGWLTRRLPRGGAGRGPPWCPCERLWLAGSPVPEAPVLSLGGWAWLP